MISFLVRNTNNNRAKYNELINVLTLMAACTKYRKYGKYVARCNTVGGKKENLQEKSEKLVVP